MTASKNIGILTGGGDVPGLNSVIKSVVYGASEMGRNVIGIRKGWQGLTHMNPAEKADADTLYHRHLTRENTRTIDRTGGTILHTSRTNPSRVASAKVPKHISSEQLKKLPLDGKNYDFTSIVVENLERLGITCLIAIGGDDTLSYGVRLHKEGFKVIAIPKTMDNDVPGTDYCIGFSTCVTRTLQLVNDLRTSAGSHERFMVIEVFGRYAGYTAMLPTMAGAANRCVIPEYKFNIERLTELLVHDRNKNPSRYSTVLVSEGAMFEGGEMIFEGEAADAYGHKKLGGIGDIVSDKVKELSKKFNKGKTIEVVNQKLGYLARCGDPDVVDSIVPMAYGNIALELLLKGIHGRLVVLHNGSYGNIPIETITSTKKIVDIKEHYNTERLRPQFSSFEAKPLFLMGS